MIYIHGRQADTQARTFARALSRRSVPFDSTTGTSSDNTSCTISSPSTSLSNGHPGYRLRRTSCQNIRIAEQCRIRQKYTFQCHGMPRRTVKKVRESGDGTDDNRHTEHQGASINAGMNRSMNRTQHGKNESPRHSNQVIQIKCRQVRREVTNAVQLVVLTSAPVLLDRSMLYMLYTSQPTAKSTNKLQNYITRKICEGFLCNATPSRPLNGSPTAQQQCVF